MGALAALLYFANLEDVNVHQGRSFEMPSPHLQLFSYSNCDLQSESFRLWIATSMANSNTREQARHPEMGGRRSGVASYL